MSRIRRVCALGALLLGLLWAQPADAAIAAVQKCNVGGNCGAATASSFTITLASNITAGNLVIVAMAINSATTTVSTVTGCTSQAGELAIRGAGNSRSAEIWYLKNATGGCSSITVTTSASVSAQPWAQEYSGADTSAPLDQTGTGTSASATAITLSATLTPTQNDELFVTAARHSGTSGTPATNFTEQLDNTAAYFQDWIQTTATGSTAEWTASVSTAYAMAGASFKVPGTASNAPRCLLLGACDQ